MSAERNEYLRQWRIRNADSIREKRHAKYLRTRDIIKQRNRARYLKNAERYRQEKREWRAAYPEEQKAISRRAYRKNKARHRAGVKRWERANPDKVKAIADRKYRRHRIKILARGKIREQKNRASINAKKRIRYHANPAYRIKKNLARRVSMKLRLRPDQPFAARTTRLVGCNVAFLKVHLESLFKPGMTWGNYGKWEVDHIRPCATFNLTDPAEQRACFHFSNLQPLWEWENASKGARWDAKCSD